MEIGKANYGGGKKKIEKIKDGSNIYRILPPLGSMAQKGRWSRYMKVEWGYKDSKGNNRPFQDCRIVNDKTKMVEQESTCHLIRENLKAKFADVVAAFKEGKATKDQVKEAKDLVERFNLEKKYFVNAINKAGEIVLLKIGYKAMQALEGELKKLQADGIDALGVETGRFFDFHRTGTGLETLCTVSTVQENVDVPGYGIMKRDTIHKLDDAIIKRLATEATDLADLDKLYPVVSAKETEAICSGPAGVDAVLGVRGGQAAQTAADDGPEDDAPVDNSAAINAANAEAAAKAAKAAEEKAKSEAAAAKAAADKAAAASAPATDAPANTGSAPAADSKEAFLASLGL